METFFKHLTTCLWSVQICAHTKDVSLRKNRTIILCVIMPIMPYHIRGSSKHPGGSCLFPNTSDLLLSKQTSVFPGCSTCQPPINIETSKEFSLDISESIFIHKANLITKKNVSLSLPVWCRISIHCQFLS